MSAALKLVPTVHDSRELLADEKVTIHGDPRTVAVAMFRKLADQLESGELQGARVQWRDGLPEMETVTMDDHTVQFLQYRIEK